MRFYNAIIITILSEDIWLAELKRVDQRCLLARDTLNKYISRPLEPNQPVGFCGVTRVSGSNDCCNRELLEKIMAVGVLDFTKHWRTFWLNISQNLRDDAQYLQDYLLRSLKLTLEGFHDLFVNSYGYNYDQNKDFVEKFFHELESYMLGNRQNIASLVNEFFDNLLIRALHVMLFVKTEADRVVAKCVASKLKPLKPFDQAPEIIRSMASRAFPPFRILRNSFLLGNHVVQSLIKTTVNHSCINEWTKLRYCNLCSGVIQPVICQHSCFSRLSTCFILWTAFDNYWLSFIDQVARVAERLKDSKSFPQVIRPLQIHISDAIMNLQTIFFRLEQSDELFSDCLPDRSKDVQSFYSRLNIRQRRQQPFLFIDHHNAISETDKHFYLYGNYDLLKSWVDSIRNKYLSLRRPFSAIIEYFCSKELLRNSIENSDHLCWTGDRLTLSSNVTLKVIENKSSIKMNPIVAHVTKNLQQITELLQSVIENNADPNFMPIIEENRINSSDNITILRPLPNHSITSPASELTTLRYLEREVLIPSKGKINSPSSRDHIKTPFQLNENPVKTSIKKQTEPDQVIYFNPPHNLWLPSIHRPLFTYLHKVIWTFDTNNGNILNSNSSTLFSICSLCIYLCIK